MSTGTNKAIIRRMVEQVMNDGRTDLVEEFFTEDIASSIVGWPPSTGQKEVKKYVAMIHHAYPDFQLTVDEALAEGDKVAIRWTMRGTNDGEMMGVPATGKKVNQSGATFYRLANGLIAETWFLADNLGLMQQLGAFPSPETN